MNRNSDIIGARLLWQRSYVVLHACNERGKGFRTDGRNLDIAPRLFYLMQSKSVSRAF